MSGLFSRKKKELKIPVPPSAEELPSFPMPKKSDAYPKEVVKQTPLEEAKTKVVKQEKEELEGREVLKIYKPIFLNVHHYKAMVDELGQLKSKMDRADDIVANLESFKGSQDTAFQKWLKQIKDVQEKLIYVDETIFKR
jgi:hypothetical protein